MKTKDGQPAHLDAAVEPSPARPFVVRLPGFVVDEQVGLGDVVTRITSQMGMRSCGACGRRAEALNRWIMFAGQRSE